MTEKVVISGLGILSPNGVGRDSFRDALRAGKSGIRKMKSPDIAALRSQIAGYLDDISLAPLLRNPQLPERLDRLALLALAAAEQAAEDARIEASLDTPHKKGVILGTSGGPVTSLEQAYERFLVERIPYVPPSLVPKTQTHSAACEIANTFQAGKITQTVSAGCASSLVALMNARQYLLSGKVDVVFLVGVETPLVFHHYRMWDSLRLLTREFNAEPERGSRPFALDRGGMVLSEGCGVIVLEREGTALERSADIYAEILGTGQTYAAPDGGEAETAAEAACMEEALADAQVPKSAVEHIQAHAVGSPLGDLTETNAIKKVFGQHASDIAVSSVKSMIGHTLGAAGVISLIAVLLGMRNGFIPPTINLEEADPECDLDYVPNAVREQPFTVAMINAFGVYGTKVSVVVRKP